MSTTATDQNFTNLAAEVAQDTAVESSAVTVLNSISAQLAAAIAANNNGDSAALPALQAALAAATGPLAAAVAANTSPPAPQAKRAP